jgi:putative transposase
MMLSDGFGEIPPNARLMECGLERRPGYVDAFACSSPRGPVMTNPGFASSKAIDRFRILQPHLEDDVPLVRIAAERGVAERTLRRWLAAWRANGVHGLERAPRSDTSKRRRLDPNLEALVRSMATRRPRPTAAAIHRKVQAEAKTRGVAGASYAVVASIVRGIGPERIAVATDAATYRDQHELVHRRDAGASNEMWQADHTVLDVLVLDVDRNPVRPWLTVVLDDYSRAIAGFFLTTSAPSAMNTALSLRQAIWRKVEPDWPVCGIPEQFYVDNGSDFVSEHIEQACIALKVRLIHSRPGRPRGRGKIERFFRTVNDMFLPDIPGHLIKGKPLSRPAIDLAELTTRFERFLHEVYHRRKHGTTGEEPLARWQFGGFLPALPESREVLDMLLMRVPKPRKVGRDGIRFMGRRYVEPTLAAFVGEQVDVLYDPRDLAEVHVHHEGVFVCRALCPEHVDAPSLASIRGARRRTKERLKQSITDDEVRYEHDESPAFERSAPRRPRFGGLKLYAADD